MQLIKVLCHITYNDPNSFVARAQQFHATVNYVYITSYTCQPLDQFEVKFTNHVGSKG